MTYQEGYESPSNMIWDDQYNAYKPLVPLYNNDYSTLYLNTKVLVLCSTIDECYNNFIPQAEEIDRSD